MLWRVSFVVGVEQSAAIDVFGDFPCGHQTAPLWCYKMNAAAPVYVQVVKSLRTRGRRRSRAARSSFDFCTRPCWMCSIRIPSTQALRECSLTNQRLHSAFLLAASVCCFYCEPSCSVFEICVASPARCPACPAAPPGPGDFKSSWTCSWQF